MNRREVIALLAILILPMAARPLSAQTQRMARIGYLTGGVPTPDGGSLTGSLAILKEGLHQLGWREGATFDVDARFAGGDFSTISRLAVELVARRLDVIVATGSTETKALQVATKEIPIVFLQVHDPLSLGIVDSIARPGGNTTGFSAGPQLLWEKRLEVLAELLGRLPHRLAWIGNPTNAGGTLGWSDAKAAAGKHAVSLTRVEVTKPNELESAFASLRDCDALLVHWDFLLYSLRKRLVELVAERRLPAVYEYRGYIVEGGLVSYGADVRDNFRRAAGYVDRILKGARPADLPVDQASRYELVINVRTAKSLGITIPPALLTRADEVIE